MLGASPEELRKMPFQALEAKAESSSCSKEADLKMVRNAKKLEASKKPC